MSYTESVNRDIKKLNFTNLYLAEILISDYINNSNNYDGMTISEISNAWHLQRTNGRYRKQFYPSYCQRKISQGNGLLSYNTISQKFTISDDADDLALLLNGSLLQEIRQLLIHQIQQ
jgi:hypothetical protein